MHNGVWGALNGLKRAGNQVFTALHQHLDCHIIGDVPILDEGPHEVEIGL